MKKQLSARRLLSLVLSIVMLFAMCITAPFVTSAESENSVTTVKFDYGDSESFNDFATVSVENGKAALPGNMPNSSKSYRTDYPVGNISGWTDGTTVFPNTGEIEIASISSAAVSNGTATLYAVYGEATADFNDLSDSQGFGSLGLGTGAAQITENAIKFTQNTGNIRIFAPVLKSHDTYATMYYNKDTAYEVSFKYKTNASLKIRAAFGVITNTVKGTGYLGGQYAVSMEEVLTTEDTNGEWKTASKKVIAPSSYSYEQGGSTYFARSIGIAVSSGTGSDTIYFDDIKITPIKSAVFNYKDGTKETAEINGDNITLLTDDSVNLMWKNGGNTYNAGATVNVADLAADSFGKYAFEAYYGEAVICYDDNIGADSDFKFWGSNCNYGTGAAAVIAGTKHITVSNRTNYGQAVLFDRSTDGKDSFVYYNTGAAYIVKLRYKSTVKANLYVAFGMSGDTDCGANQNYKKPLATVEPTEEWTTVSGIVTAPDEYNLSYKITKRVGIGFEQLSNGTTEYDNIELTPVEGLTHIRVDLGSSDAIGDGYDMYSDGTFTFPYAPADCLNEISWTNGGKTYKEGTTVSLDELTANSDGTYTVTAVYGKAESNFNSLPDNMDLSVFDAGAIKGPVTNEDGSKSVKVITNTDSVTDPSDAGRQLLIMGKDGDYYKYINYTPGKKYTAFITYKVNSIAENAQLKLGIGYGPIQRQYNTARTSQNANGGEIQPVASIITSKTDGFVTEAATFTAYSAYNSQNVPTSRRMTVAFAAPLNTEFEIKSLEVIPEEECTAIRFETGNGTLKSIPFKTLPEIIEMPAKPDDCANEFCWKNGDSEFEAGAILRTSEVELTSSENGSYIFTATYKKATADFSTFPDDHKFETGAAKLAKDAEGKNILKVNVNTVDNRQVPLFNFVNGSKLNVNYTPGKEYVASVTAKVNYINNGSGQLNLGLGFSPFDPDRTTGDSWKSANPEKNSPNSIANIATVTAATNGYVTYTGVFTAPKTAGNGNFVTTLVFGGVSAGNAEFEITKVMIIPVEDCTVITLHYNRGTGDANNISVPAGEAYTLPEPVWDGYKFAGWYTDSTCLTAAADPYIPTDGDELWADYIPDGAIGDVNADGTVDIRDLVRLKNTAAGNGTANDVIRADINRDGADLFADDIVLLRKILLGITVDVDIVGSYIAGIPVENFQIVMNDSSFADVNAAADMLSSTLGKSIVSDGTVETEFEILIGSTNRAESLDGLNSGYEIYVTDKKLVINAADDATLAQAILLVNRYFKHATDKKMALILNHGFKKKI